MIFKDDGLDMGSIRFKQICPFVEYSIDDIPHYTKPADADVTANGRYYTQFGYAKRKKYIFYNDDIVLMLAVDYPEKESCFIINVAVKNNRNSEIVLNKIGLASINHIDYIGDGSEWMLTGITHAPHNGTLSENFSTETGRPGRRIYKDFLSLFNNEGKGVFMGPYGAPEADLVFECDVINGIFSMDIFSDMSNITIESGETRDAQSVVIMNGGRHESTRRIFDALVTTHGTRNTKPPLSGWTSRYCLGFNPDEISIVKAAQAVCDNNPKLDLIQIDDGYQICCGNWNGNEKFPSGLSYCADEIKKSGAIAGIRIAPLYVDECLGLYSKCPEMFLHKCSGDAVTAVSDSDGKKCYILDPTHPLAHEYIRKIIKDKVNEGFEYLKIDCNTLDSDAKYFNTELTGLQVMRQLYKLYRDTVGESVYINAATCGIDRGIMGYADICRTGDDSCPKWNKHGKTGAIWDKKGEACTILKALRSAGQSVDANRRFFVNDPDIIFLENTSFEHKVAKKANTGIDEITTWNTFAGLNGGCVNLSHPIWENNSGANEDFIKKLTPPYPANAFSAKAGFDTDFTQFGYFWDRSFGISSTFMVWNNSKNKKHVTIDNAHLTSLGGEFHMWSFWDEKYLGLGKDEAEKIVLKPHQCAAFKATVISDEMAPAFLGSTLHISMGACEVSKYIFGKTGCKFVLNTNGSGSGALYVFSRKPLKLTLAKNLTASVHSSQKNVYKIEISNRSKTEKQIIQLDY